MTYKKEWLQLISRGADSTVKTWASVLYQQL